MDRALVHLEIRNALNVADELSRYETGPESLLGYYLAALRTALAELDKDMGGAGPSVSAGGTLSRVLQRVRGHRDEIPSEVKGRLEVLIASTERIVLGLTAPEEPVPSKPVLGGLPLARVLPHQAHAALDVASSLAAAAGAFVAHDPAALASSVGLAVAGLGVTALTDSPESVTRVVPVEHHARFDLVWGLAAAALPFVFGYAKKSPVTAALHVGAGVLHVAGSLLTDYRAVRGLTSPVRSKGGPDARLPADEKLQAALGPSEPDFAVEELIVIAEGGPRP